MISTVEVLKLMEAFVNEPNYTVWSDLSCNLGVLSSLLSHTDFHEEIQEFIRDLFTPIGMKLGWDSKPGEGEGGGSEAGCLAAYLSNRHVLNFCRRSPGCPAERPGPGEAGEGGAQTHPGGGQKEIQGPCGGQTGPSCRSQKPRKRWKNQPVDASSQHRTVKEDEQSSQADVCVLSGVFNSAEARRQFHTGHHAEGTITVSQLLCPNSSTFVCGALTSSSTNKPTCRRRRTVLSEFSVPFLPPTSSRKSSTLPSRYAPARSLGSSHTEAVLFFYQLPSRK